MDNEKFKKYSLEIMAECSHAQLRTLNELVVNTLRANRAHEIAKAKLVFAVGQAVYFTNKGIRFTGEIHKINRTTASVMETSPRRGVMWKVGLSLLKAA